MNKNSAKIPTYLGLFVLVAGVVAGVLLINNRQLFKLRAAESVKPKNIRISNISDDSFTVTWTTDNKAWDSVRYWEEGSILKNESAGNIREKRYIHSINISGLKPATNYFFIIESDGFKFDNDTLTWKVKTALLNPSPHSLKISGQVLTPSKIPVNEALVYANIGGGALYSTPVENNGVFVFELNDLRTKTLLPFQEYNAENTLIEIFAQAGPLGVSSAQAYPVNADPLPPLTLGETHNYKNLENSDLP